MTRRVLDVVLQMVLGLVLAGLLMAAIVPFTGRSAGPATAVAVTLFSLLLVALVWRWATRSRDGDIARR